MSYDQNQAPGTPPTKVTLILGVDPLLEPANGPTLFPFDPGILYEIRIDNNRNAVADVIFGEAPIVELSRFEETNAIGGAIGVRGVPAQRYYGKAKLFGNVETRTDVFDFHLLGKDMTLGFVTFFDAGRVWADLRSQPQLNGTGLGLHYGVGTGLRLRVGETLMLRGDVAYSPEAPWSGYFQANHAF